MNVIGKIGNIVVSFVVKVYVMYVQLIALSQSRDTPKRIT